MINVDHIYEWFVNGVPGAVTPMDVVNRLLPDLNEAGIPVHLSEVFVRTLHPNISGRSFLWQSDRPLEVTEKTYAYLQSDEFVDSPVGRVFETGKIIRCNLKDSGNHQNFSTMTKLFEKGYSDFLACPLTFLNGEFHAVTYATKHPNGFNKEQICAIEKTLPPFSRIAEIFALTRTAVNLLNTYVGHGAGERILSGKIRLGDSDIIRAVIWFSDLRGFTSLSSSREPGKIIAILNELFGCQVPAIEKRGGEVLKFIGDGLFAVFPLIEEMEKSGPLCDRVLEAARDAFTTLESVNVRRKARGEEEIQFGLALHIGEIAFGNIGGAGRLDFTCIGPAVNLAARLEGLTGKLQKPILLSGEFANLTSNPVQSLGKFELKGLSEKKSVFAPSKRFFEKPK